VQTWRVFGDGQGVGAHLRKHGRRERREPHDVQKLLGHQDIAMTQRYAHLSDEGLERATAGVASLFDHAA